MEAIATGLVAGGDYMYPGTGNYHTKLQTKLEPPPDFQWGPGAARLSTSTADLPQGPFDILVLIVARCVKQCPCRFTHFTAAAVPKAVV